MTLYKIKQECYLLGALVNAGAQHTLKGKLACLVAESCLTQGKGEGGGPNGQRKCFMFTFFLACLNIGVFIFSISVVFRDWLLY